MDTTNGNRVPVYANKDLIQASKAIHDEVKAYCEKRLEEVAQSVKSISNDTKDMENAIITKVAMRVGQELKDQVAESVIQHQKEFSTKLGELDRKLDQLLSSLESKLESRLTEIDKKLEVKLRETDEDFEDRLSSAVDEIRQAIREQNEAHNNRMDDIRAGYENGQVQLKELLQATHAPVINVTVPKLEQPVIHLTAPKLEAPKLPDIHIDVKPTPLSIVNKVPEQPAPNIKVEIPRRKTIKKFTYDPHTGRPESVVEEDQ